MRDPLHRALIDLCFERGYAALTVEDVCERAGIARAEFDAQYGSLEDLFLAAYTAEFDRYRARVEAARAGLTGWRERLRATAYALLRYLGEDERATHFGVVEARRGGERAQLLIGKGIEELIDLLDEGRAEPGAPGNLTRATAESVAGGLFNQLFLAVARGRSGPEAEIVHEAMYSAVLPYLGAEIATEELRIPPPPRSGRLRSPAPITFRRA